jgi:CBS-domain-containing membrane protein
MNSTMLETTVRDLMQPLPPTVTTRTSAAEALAIMQREDAAFLPVVIADTDRFAGVVLRRALERGCVGMGHREARCLVLNHLKADVEFCLIDEPAEPALRDDARRKEPGDSLPVRARNRWRLPIIVVDEQKVPIGMVERSAT